MPRYHFNVLDGVIHHDETGTEMLSIAEAKQQARRYAADMLADSVLASNPGDRWQIEVTDDQKLVLFSLDIAMHDAVAMEVP